MNWAAEKGITVETGFSKERRNERKRTKRLLWCLGGVGILCRENLVSVGAGRRQVDTTEHRHVGDLEASSFAVHRCI